MPEISVKITAFYAGLNALVMLTLALMVVRARRKAGVGLGHDDPSGNTLLRQAGRAHANNVEYVPMALILIGILEVAQMPALFLHILGGMLTVGRIAHGWGMSTSGERTPGRSAGTALTWLTFVLGALAALWYAVG